MPWKNGGGETTQIALRPVEASLENFDWRVSMARIETDGPFSLFPDVDRTFLLLEGGALKLDIEGCQPLLLSASSGPVSFPADRSASSSCPSGPVTDLNIMTRRGRFRHIVEKQSAARALAAVCDSDAMIAFSCSPAALSYGDSRVALGARGAVLAVFAT